MCIYPIDSWLQNNYRNKLYFTQMAHNPSNNQGSGQDTVIFKWQDELSKRNNKFKNCKKFRRLRFYGKDAIE